MSINRIHRKQHNFSMIDNEAAEAKNLTWGARGLLWYLLTKPDHWELKTEHLATQSDTEGKKRVLTLIRELEMAGYIIRWSERGDRGRIEWYNEIFECLNDKNEWLKKNQERISRCFSLSKGTSAMYPEKAHGQKTSNAHSENSVSGIPTMHPLGIDGAPIDGGADSGNRNILINTDEVTTELVSTELELQEIKENDFFQKSDFVENGFIEDPTSAQIEALRAELIEASDKLNAALAIESTPINTLAVIEKVPPPRENGSQIIKTAADVKPALDALCPAMTKKEHAKHQNDAFEMFWTLFSEGWKAAGTDFPVSRGTRAPAAKNWDALFKGSKHPEQLAQAIVQGTELYWEGKRSNGDRSAVSAASFLSGGHWKASLEQSKSHSNNQPAQRFGPFLACWNQDRPTAWPPAEESDLSPKCVGRLEELIASCNNSLERFQKALLFCKRDKHWGLECSFTFERFLYSGKINEFWKIQIHHERIGLDKTIAPDRKAVEAAAKREASRQESIARLLDEYRRGEISKEDLRACFVSVDIDPDSVLEAR